MNRPRNLYRGLLEQEPGDFLSFFFPQGWWPSAPPINVFAFPCIDLAEAVQARFSAAIVCMQFLAILRADALVKRPLLARST